PPSKSRRIRRGSRLRRPSSVVALDWGIYVIGGSREGEPRCCDVLHLDCRAHTWSRAPSMGVARASAAVGVVGGKIYVLGGCRDRDCSKWAEVFDPKTQTWDSLPPPPECIRDTVYIHESVVVMEEKVYAVDGRWTTFYYSPRENKWGRGNTIPPQGNKRDWCVIDKVIYACDEHGVLSWCEVEQLEGPPEGMYWRDVKGLGSLKESLSSSRLVHFDSNLEALWEREKIRRGVQGNLVDKLPGARLCKSGGNIVVFWDKGDLDPDDIWCADIEIRCAEISLQRRGGEIWSNEEWNNTVMTVNPFSDRYKVREITSLWQTDELRRTTDSVEKTVRCKIGGFTKKCHPWICENGVAPDRALDPAVLSRLKQLSAMNKLKKMALSLHQVIAESLSEEEIAGFRDMFSSMDTDNSGAITFDERRRVI
ncbi:unnamed protein product, partial [Thlaspi arvense]